jgi:hypothetical protein
MEFAIDDNHIEFDIDRRIQDRANTISHDHLINKLNQAHFFNRTVRINFICPITRNLFGIEAKPQPCLGKELTCRLVKAADRSREISDGAFHSIFLEDKERLIVFRPSLLAINESEAVFRLLPEIKAVNSRSSTRYCCEDVTAEISQAGRSFDGQVINMNSAALSVIFTANDFEIMGVFGKGSEVALGLYAGDERIFSGKCLIKRRSADSGEITLVLLPLQTKVQYMKEKMHRSIRVKLAPLPEARFFHPLIGRNIALKIEEISGTGFAVIEKENHGVLFPGMEFPNIEIHIAPGFSIECKAQVIHCLKHESGLRTSCGLAITEIAADDHVKLVAHLQQARNPWAYVSCNVELEDIWELFFNSGFVYPKKYAAFHPYKDAINSLYQKLYGNGSLKFIKNLIYKENGIVKGHIGLIRTFTNTWLMHHLAGKGSGSEMPGLAVLNQVGSFINDSYGMESNAMKYATTYYRPDNKVPNLLFGGVARSANNPKVCSLNTFAYFYHRNSNRKNTSLKKAGLKHVTPEDLLEFADFYEHRSGGLMVEALDLVPERAEEDILRDVYSEEGFYRERNLYSMKKNNRLKAIIMAYRSDIGLNLSELTNGLHVWVLDSDGLSQDEFKKALNALAATFEQPFVAVNLYPRRAAERFSIKYEKEYTLWIMEMKYSDHYFNHLQRISRFFRH